MKPRPKDTIATIIPGLVYRNAAAAIEWLCDTFGFEKLAAYEGADGTIMHAELRFGNGMIMLGSGTETAFGKLIKRPEQIGGFETQAPYVIVEDADVVYERAKAAGAQIVIEIKTEDYGGRGFTCRDLEGHLWSFGTYDPWVAK